MRKNNIWNKIFHRKEVQNNIEQMYICMKVISEENNFLNKIDKCDSLSDLVNIHKDMWSIGFKNSNIGPCSYGMFRTKDIANMSSSEVYLGGVYGLNTYAIPYWEEHKEDTYGYNGFGMNPDHKLYTIVLEQYKRLLKGNIFNICAESKKLLKTLEKNGY